MQGSEQINEILLNLGIKAPTFAKRIGVPYHRILDIQRGKVKKISGEVANYIVNAYPKFDINWLLTGQGSMLKEESAGDSDATQSAGINHTDMEKRLLEALERRDRDVDRLLTIIERMQHPDNENKQGGGILNP